MTVYGRLLHKKNKSNMVLNGYRVISLMVICLRISSPIMARRLLPLLDTELGQFQKAYVPTRRMEHQYFATK